MNPLSQLYTEIIYRPLLNGLVFIYAVLPYQDLGLAIFILTLVVRLLLHPTVVSAVRTQLALPVVRTKLQDIQQRFKGNKEEQLRRSLAVYREYGIHPLSSVIPLVVQIPVFLGLFQLFRSGIALSDPTLLYPFTPAIPGFHPIAFGIFNLTSRSISLSVAAGVSQFFQGKFSPRPPDMPGTSDDVARAMRWQSIYLFPVVFSAFALFLPSALAFYWTVLNILAIVQQLWIQRRLMHERNPRAHPTNP